MGNSCQQYELEDESNNQNESEVNNQFNDPYFQKKIEIKVKHQNQQSFQENNLKKYVEDRKKIGGNRSIWEKIPPQSEQKVDNLIQIKNFKLQSQDEIFIKGVEKNKNVSIKVQQPIQEAEFTILKQAKEVDSEEEDNIEVTHQIEEQKHDSGKTFVKRVEKLKTGSIKVKQPHQEAEFTILKQSKEVNSEEEDNIEVVRQIEEQKHDPGQTFVKKDKKDKSTSIKVTQLNQEGESTILKQIKETESDEQDNINDKHQVEKPKQVKDQGVKKGDKEDINVPLKNQQQSKKGDLTSQKSNQKQQPNKQDSKIKKDSVQAPKKEQRIMNPQEKHMLQNQSMRFGTHKKLNHHHKLMRKAVGVGRDGEDFFIRKITQTGRKKFLFEINTIDNYSKKCEYIQIEVTENQYRILDELMDQIYSIMCFQIGIQKYKGAPDGGPDPQWQNIKEFKRRTYKMFKQAFEF